MSAGATPAGLLTATVDNRIMRGSTRLAHGWKLVRAPGIAGPLVADFIRPAIRAVPFAMAKRLGPCRVALTPGFEASDQTSKWSVTPRAVEISIVAENAGAHDAALELLVCLGQVLWDKLSAAERAAYWRLLEAEIRQGISGEIDEAALEAKQQVLAGRARSLQRLEQYGLASFAATAAEYVHSLWHDVSIREGPDHLPARQLRRRLALLARWFPANPGYRLYAAQPRPGAQKPARRLPASHVK